MTNATTRRPFGICDNNGWIIGYATRREAVRDLCINKGGGTLYLVARDLDTGDWFSSKLTKREQQQMDDALVR